MVPPIRLWDAGVPNRAALSDHDPQLPDARVARRRPRRRVLGLPDGRPPARRAVRAVRRRASSSRASTPSSTAPRRRTAARSSARSRWARGPGRTTPSTTGSTSRGCTRSGSPSPGRRPTTRTASGWSSTSTAPAPRPRARSTTAATTATACSSRSGWRRSCATSPTSPERMAELDVNEGVVPLIEMRFPEPGTLLTPVFPAPTNARTFVILRLLGVLAGVLAKAVDGRMPADQETIRYTGVYGEDRDGQPYLMREVLGGGSGGRYYADGEDTIHVVPGLPQPAERVHRVAVPVPRRVARAGDRLRWGGGAPRRARLREAHPDAQGRSLHVHRRPLDPGLLGRAWRHGPASRSRSPSTPAARTNGSVDALADDEPVRAGEVIRIRTTGGGGWGDPLVRDPALVVRDVVWRKVSAEAALADYGVVLTGSLDADDLGFDEPATRRRAGRAGAPGRDRAVLRPRARATPGCPAGPPPRTWTTCDDRLRARRRGPSPRPRWSR